MDSKNIEDEVTELRNQFQALVSFLGQQPNIDRLTLEAAIQSATRKPQIGDSQ